MILFLISVKSDPGKEELMLVDSDIPGVGDEVDIQQDTGADVPQPTNCAQLVNLPDKSGMYLPRFGFIHAIE